MDHFPFTCSPLCQDLQLVHVYRLKPEIWSLGGCFLGLMGVYHGIPDIPGITRCSPWDLRHGTSHIIQLRQARGPRILQRLKEHQPTLLALQEYDVHDPWGKLLRSKKQTVGVHPTKSWWKVREVSHKKCPNKVRFQIFLEFAQIDPWQREKQEERFRVAEGFRTQEFGSHGKCVVMELWGGSRHTFCFVALIQRFCVETWII